MIRQTEHGFGVVVHALLVTCLVPATPPAAAADHPAAPMGRILPDGVAVLRCEQTTAGEGTVNLAAVEPLKQTGEVSTDRNPEKGPLDLGDVVYATGLGVRAGSDLTYDVSQRAGRFEAWAGIDPNASAGRSGRFRVYADRDLVFSVCEWGRERPWLWAPGFNAEMWRTTYDVTAMNEQTRSILLNRQVIAVNQDPLGVPGWRVKKMDQVEVWKRPLAGADIAVAFVNLDEKPRTIKVSWAQLNVLGPREVMDLWRHRSLGKHDSRLTFENIPSHGVVFVRLSK